MIDFILKEIPGFPNYYASDNGYIFTYSESKKRNVAIPSHRSSRGYWMVGVVDDKGIRRKIGVHRLVALAFCERPAGYNIVHHLDGDRENNAASNLVWLNPSFHTKLHQQK